MGCQLFYQLVYVSASVFQLARNAPPQIQPLKPRIARPFHPPRRRRIDCLLGISQIRKHNPSNTHCRAGIGLIFHPTTVVVHPQRNQLVIPAILAQQLKELPAGINIWCANMGGQRGTRPRWLPFQPSGAEPLINGSLNSTSLVPGTLLQHRHRRAVAMHRTWRTQHTANIMHKINTPTASNMTQRRLKLVIQRLHFNGINDHVEAPVQMYASPAVNNECGLNRRQVHHLKSLGQPGQHLRSLMRRPIVDVSPDACRSRERRFRATASVWWLHDDSVRVVHVTRLGCDEPVVPLLGFRPLRRSIRTPTRGPRKHTGRVGCCPPCFMFKLTTHMSDSSPA